MIYELQSALSNVQILVNSLGILNTVYHLALCSALILHEHMCVCVCVCVYPKEQRRVWMRFTSNDAYGVHCNHFKILVGYLGPLCLFWVIWKARNSIAFEDGVLSIQKLKISFVYLL